MLIGCGQVPEKKSEDKLDAEVANLERQVKSLQDRLAKTNQRIKDLLLDLGPDVQPVVEGGYRSAPNIIEEMMEIKVSPTNRRATQRRLSFLLESLAAQGEASVPHIRDFLELMEDVDYAYPRSEKDTANELEHWRSRMVRVPLDFETPPSLRIGLIDILAEIGGADAEDAIARVLATTGRGFEVAYSASKLRSLAGKDAYTAEALGAAHELLSEPIEVVGGNKYDAASKQYLFMVLEMYQDKTFIETAQEMFVREDGRIDRSVLRYFEEVGKEHAFQSVAQAMQSGQLRSDEMMQLTQVAVHSMGKKNPQGDALFRDIMTNDKYSHDVKMQTIRSMDDINDPETLQSRLAMMNTIQYGEDDIMGRANEIYSGRVESKLAKQDFGDDKQYNAMHAEFRKINEQVRREQRSRGGDGILNRLAAPAPTIITTGRPGD